MTSELKLYQKKTRLLVGGGAMGIFLVALIFMLISGPNPDSVFAPFRSAMIFYPMAIGGIALLGYFVWFAYKGLTNPKPRVTISDAGVAVDGFSGRFNANWDEFSGYAVANGPIYVLKLKDLQAFTSRQPAGRQQETVKALSQRFGSPFLIEIGMLDTDEETVRKAVSARLQPVSV